MSDSPNKPSRCNAQDAPPWSLAEDKALEPYVLYKISRAEMCARLPHRSIKAITVRASGIRQKMGIARKIKKTTRPTEYGSEGYDYAYTVFRNQTARSSATLLEAMRRVYG